MPVVDLQTAVNILKNSGIVAFPTETVYGLGAVATNEIAIKKVFEVKNRPADNPLICHFYSVDQIREYDIEIPQIAQILFKEFSPGPVSILLNLPKNSPLKVATAGQTKIICRIPNHPLALELIKKLNMPIVGPSANISGRPSGTNTQMVIDQFGDKIDGVIDGGDCGIGLESSILDITDQDDIKILRPGAIGYSEIEPILEKYNLDINIINSETTKNIIPGAKYPHYSPITPIFKISYLEEIVATKNFAILGCTETLKKFNLRDDLNKNIIVVDLGSKTSVKDISRDLYRNLQSVDELKVKLAYLFNEDFKDGSISQALSNRLNKVGQN
jgi:L-threonylcarbamoyladenylate synthase